MSRMTTLSEYTTVQGGYAYKSADFLKSGKFRVLKIKNIRFGYIDYSETDFIDEKLSEKTKDWMVKPKDILISMTGSGPNAPASLVGRVARVGRNEPISFINQRIGKIIVNDKIHPDFIYYLLSQKASQEYFVNNSTGSANQVNINANTILSLEVPKISFDESKKIADILNCFDEKIQLNTQINQTLEQIAQAIFKSWFVDFDPVLAKADALAQGKTQAEAELAAQQIISGKTPEELTALSQTHPDQYAELAEIARAFPCEFEEIDGFEVPRGWGYQTVGSLINVVDYVANGSFATLKENVTLLSEPSYAIYVRTTDFNSGFSKELRYVDKSAYDFLEKSVLIGNEVIISNVGDVGTVFRSPSWLGMPMTLGSNAIALKNYDIPHYLYLHFISYKGQQDISSIITGSAQLKFNKTNFRSLQILIPNNKTLSIFEKIVNPIFERIDKNMNKNLKLSEIRDLLLPKLLNGDLICQQ
ncbi:restriction endonuclease subunit S [Rodentibacter ratti]|uniref:Type I restriction modification DNA specificity domain-containing protein n=1 Tax=Rodentibacter ratti TaxID=1906745 RepID=A0A1V3L5B6_9PAST|nr:restriction endonuclease subunit S [Rodentibacter ratti]OOF85045.1 hypothetical protein BKG88_08745 [Rodentibacter ratti]